MMRILVTGAALSLAAGAAFAQTPPSATPPASSTQVNPPNSAASPNPPAPASATAAATPPAADTTATAGSPYRTGATIKDAQGQTIGTIARVIKTPDGATTVSVTVDGRNVNLAASNLTPSADGGAVSTMSKAQISASTKPPM
jgi:hypothetical protein